MDESTRPAVAVSAGSTSAVSWAAILAGAAVAVAASLVLFALATGLDLASLSPTRGAGAGGQIAIAAIGLIVTQWVSAGLGGYVTGRLRTRWVGTHTHEVFFRDTAHGLITWCVATIVIASGVAAASSAGVGPHARIFGHTRFEGGPAILNAPGSVGGVVQETVSDEAAAGELVIPESAADSGRSADTQTAPMITTGMAFEPASPRAELAARRYAADQPPPEDGESLRKDAAISSIFTSLSMLIGAFIACVAGAIGGRLRDEHP
jgi:hypothetical protein